MVVWHEAHWATWGRQKYFDAVFPEIYKKLLPSSIARAAAMGWEGARWPKMTETVSGVSSPGGINGLLLWQQVCEEATPCNAKQGKLTSSRTQCYWPPWHTRPTPTKRH